ncbi:MAG: thioredoxin family protein [Chloroflexota bacterium]
MDRVLILAAAGGVLLALVLTARGVAGWRTARAQALAGTEVWSTLDAHPDGRPAVVLFTTPSCAECATQRALLDGLRVIEVDASAQPQVAARFGVLTAPTTAVLDPDGGVIAVNHGFAGSEKLAAQLA